MVRSAVLRSLPALAGLGAGIIIAVLAGSGDVLFIVGLALTGVAAAALASLFFYEVGRSEDLERRP